jgi:predicted AAA+ superfamily ATPase
MEFLGVGFPIFLYICLMIRRTAQKKLLSLSKTFKAVAVIGPRQSGKSTLVRHTFPKKVYVSLEEPDQRNFAIEDPKGFLAQFPDGAILDEIQRTPQLFSYLQLILDSRSDKGLFILTGSNNFLLQEQITQSLAGRIAFLSLLPFSEYELHPLGEVPTLYRMFTGYFPPVYDQNIPITDWMPNYIRTYIERDVRQIKNITDLLVFERFMRILAGRTGQELNLSALSNVVGVDQKTIQSWIGILESSFIIFLLRSHHKNFNKTIVKRPKLYFYDTGMVCALLRITQIQQLEIHPLLGAIFETMVVSDLVKHYSHNGIEPPLYYWRDKTGREVDVLIEINPKEIIPIEIKAGGTFQTEWLKNIKYWQKLSLQDKAVVLYNGSLEQKRSNQTDILNWKNRSFLSKS